MSKAISPTVFFSPHTYIAGNHHCYYCNAACSEDYLAKDYVREKFTNRDIVPRPGSRYVCGGCVASFSEKATVTLIDGEIRENQRVRTYSWLLTKDRALAATKRHLKQIREFILNPPAPPFRAKLAHSTGNFPVMLEEEIIPVSPSELSARIEFLKPIVAATGKPALSGSDLTRLAIVLTDYHGDDGMRLFNRLITMREEPLTRLAAWLSPNKEGCQNEYPANGKTDSGGVQTKNRRVR